MANLQLVFKDQLVNSLFVVFIRDANPDLTRAILLASSPLSALDKFVAVNEYIVDFHATNPTFLYELMIAIIKHDNPFIYLFWTRSLLPLGESFTSHGRVIHKSMDTGIANYCIIALVETTNTHFVAQIRFHLSHFCSILILLDYVGVQPSRLYFTKIR